jgi:hypothetical protein
MGNQPSPCPGGSCKSRCCRQRRRRLRSIARTMGHAADVQGRSPQLRRLDLRRHLHADRQAFRGRLGRARRRDDLLFQRSSDQARDHVRGRREDRRLAILALLLPELRQPGPRRAARRPAGRRRLHQGLHALHQAGRDDERQDARPALLRRRLGVELLRRHAGEAEDRQAVHDLRGIHRALREGQEGWCLALSGAVGGGRRPRAAAGHLVPDDLEQGRHLLRQAGQPHAGRGLRLRARP